jgi:hypothetical protein
MGGGSSGPTQQQQNLATEQGVTNAQLNLEENEQRKVILNAMQGTRVFRGSALSRMMAGNTAATTPPVPTGVSNQQQNYGAMFGSTAGSLLDVGGATPAGGKGASPVPTAPVRK